MDIANVTIVVRGTRGETKKSVFDADGKLVRGDAHLLLEEAQWNPAVPDSPPLSPEDAVAAAPITADGVDELDIDELPSEDDVPEE